MKGVQSHRITTHYNPAKVKHLIDAANTVCLRQISTPILTVIRTMTVESVTASY